MLHLTKSSYFASSFSYFSPDSLLPTMVVSLGPGKFYGTSLPRPRIYNDVKFNDHRVDPPVPVADPFMSWANEAHWSMGGLSLKRLRLQGKIEGNVNKLRAEREKLFKKLNRSPVAASIPFGPKSENVVGGKRASPVSPPPAPVPAKRRRFLAMIEEDNGGGGNSRGGGG
ncbi:uncharacterized protein LOC129296035 [Prosopis cineraria]|uniref:uncharacterized protein LOC129296035 n=1 Tax=Prosopis cineraria TaxID=364024 RepID=UPI00240EE980|nr:uncharacterized protein LOC129296035 [Prosopis cineraria]